MVDRAAMAKFTVLNQIYDLAREQRQALERDDLDRFQRILDQREELITRLRMLNGGDREAAELPDNLLAFPLPSDSAAEDGLALDTVIRGILDRDRDNQSLLAEKLDEIRCALPALTVGHRAATGYRIDRPPAAFVDRIS
jgi:hypothetical protein